jgi:hypothetical protein
VDCVVADAVAVEPVSTMKIPDNREKYRENQKNKPEATTTSSLNTATNGFLTKSVVKVNREQFQRNRETIAK